MGEGLSWLTRTKEVVRLLYRDISPVRLLISSWVPVASVMSDSVIA